MVGTDAGGTPELIDDGVSGLLFKPHSSADLARVLREYLHNPSLARQHGDAGRQRAERLFNIDIVMSRILKLVST